MGLVNDVFSFGSFPILLHGLLDVPERFLYNIPITKQPDAMAPKSQTEIVAVAQGRSDVYPVQNDKRILKKKSREKGNLARHTPYQGG